MFLIDYKYCRYIENAANYYDKKLTRTPNSGKEPDLHYLRDQLGLVHLQLHFERYRREVHAVRNRRLLGETRSNRVLEEHNAALQNQSILMQRENETLQFQLGDKRNDLDSKHKDFQDAVNFWKKQVHNFKSYLRLMKLPLTSHILCYLVGKGTWNFELSSF